LEHRFIDCWLYSLVLKSRRNAGLSKNSTNNLLAFFPKRFVLTAWVLISLMQVLNGQELPPPAWLNEPAPDSVWTDSADSSMVQMPEIQAQGDSLLKISETPAQKKSDGGLSAKVVYDARDSIIYNVVEQKVYLYGKAVVVYEAIKLEADYIVYSFAGNEVYAKGKLDTLGRKVGYPVFTEGSQTFEADTIKYNFISKKGLVHRVHTQEGENYVQASVSKYHTDGTIHNYKGIFTTCNNPKPHYGFHFKKLMVIPDDKIVSGGAIMKFRKIPTPLMLPFGYFPIENKEKAGVILPTWGDSEDLGFFFLNGGYYVPISDHIDTRFLGDIYTGGSWALRNFTNYKKRYRYNGDFNFDYNRQRRGDPEFANFSRNTQFFVRWKHTQDPKARPDSRFSADLNVGSSNAFTNHLNSTQQDFLTNTFNSNIQYSKSFAGRPYSLTASARHSQNSRTGQYDFTLPQITFNVARVFLPLSFLRSNKLGAKKWYEKIGLNYQGNFENRLTVAEEDLNFNNINNLRRDLRNGVRHNLGMSTSLKFWQFAFNPGFNMTDRWYFQSIKKSIDETTLLTKTDTLSGFWSVMDWNLNANLTTKIYGMYQFKGERIKAIRHVMTPTVGFNFRPDFSTQQYGFFGDGGNLSSYSPYDIGIYGKPPIGRSGAVNLGLINNIEMKGASKRDSTGYQKIRLIDNLSATTAYDMFRDTLKWSNVNINGRTTLFKKINLNVNSSFSPYSYDDLGRTINASMLKDRGKILRFTNGNVAIGGSIQSKTKTDSKPKNTKRGSAEELEFIEQNPGYFVDWSVPWTINANYTINASSSFYQQGGQTRDTLIVSQSVMFNGDVSIFAKWKIGVNSGFDFQTKRPTTTTLTLYWDLHCWEFQASVVPFGIRKSYQFHVNVKASILQDLKLQRRGNLGSNQNYF
jgi:hypothetical protein